MSATYKCNLVLVHTPHLQARTDFETIKAILRARAPDIEVFVVSNDMPNSVSRRRAANRPTLVFSPVALRAFRPARGKIYVGKSHPKFEEYKRLAAAGIRIPECVVLQPHTRLDPATWGPFTILKPNVGSQGGGVRIQRTTDVRWVDPFSWPPGDPRYGHQMLAQRFVDTGAHATSYRVFTVLGAGVYCIVSRSVEARPFRLDAAGNDSLDHPVAANSGERTVTCEHDHDIIQAGMGAARSGAFPDIPVLGVDVIRDERTGVLYVLETNLGGQTWHLSSDYGRALQARHGLDFYAQFGALDIIAQAMIETTRREAV